MEEMELRPQAWNEIFEKDGRVYNETFPRFEWLVEQFKLHGCQSILDLGCGSGRHVVNLSRQHFRVWGLDFSPVGLRLAQRWLDEEGVAAPLVLADMRFGLPFRDGNFDGLLSTQVIHHAKLKTVVQTVKAIWRVVKPGGLVFVSVPAHRHADEEYIEIEPNTFVPLEGGEKGLPHHIFSEEEFGELFEAFDIIELSTRGDRVITLLATKPYEGTKG
jgi:SAM-dependent methyltransferase